ncbi:hypothetical protein C0Q70_05492 [Pomacea canaliculata]|uniref:Cadherin domain-containing protein n=1 Tax=Pomacea canaliculata TaxID=400727 RepID=A0A2T7PLC2_POMCA|nr:hypothetical protein C0Q70_05492 [Pomacea canaliculata]
MDENDNRPKFVDRAGRLTVLAETKGSHDILVYRTLAYDVDEGPNAEITYTLRSTLDDQFFISSRTGEIFSRKDLVAGQNFDLTVRAADRGADNLKTQQKIGISVVARPVTSLAPPHFRHTGLRESITESDKPGQLIVLLSADDADKDRLYFAITDGNEDQVFTIQPNHGSILLALPVDWETRSSYNLTVSVTDGVHYDFTWSGYERRLLSWCLDSLHIVMGHWDMFNVMEHCLCKDVDGR